jgi:hypothetical protein
MTFSCSSFITDFDKPFSHCYSEEPLLLLAPFHLLFVVSFRGSRGDVPCCFIGFGVCVSLCDEKSVASIYLYHHLEQPQTTKYPKQKSPPNSKYSIRSLEPNNKHAKNDNTGVFGCLGARRGGKGCGQGK